MDAILMAEQLCFLNNIHYPHIEIRPNQVNFIRGESGSGKSTLLKLFNGMLTPRAGAVFYKGANITDMDTIVLRKEVLLAGQSVFLFDDTIEENFRQFYAYRELPPPGQEEMQAYLAICCADFSLDTQCATMSGGERQRVYIAIFLSFLPAVLMLDEPTSALDGASSSCLLSHLKSFCSEHKITLVVVSHDEGLANRFADHTILIKRSV